MENTKLKKINKPIRKLIIFIIFQVIFLIVFMPILIFYGPFENIKRTLVGASYNTLNHQYIAKMFLSDEAIFRILERNFAKDSIDQGTDEIKSINFKANHTNKLNIYNIEGEGFVGKLMIIYDPTRVLIGYSSQMPKAGETTSTIAKRNGASAAINAGGFMDTHWAGTGGAPMGFLIHDKKLIYNQLNDESAKQETVAITEDGMLIVGKHSLEKLKKAKIKEAVSFGPPLIINGKPTIKNGDGGWGIAPRTAIGQREDGSILFLTIDGRSLKSLGATLRDVQDILLKNEAINASNLDGGSSTTMYYNGKIINIPSDALGERAVPSVFYVSN